MKKLLLILSAVVVLAIGGLSVYVSLIDWNEHKDKISAQFNDITGKRVVFDGPVSFTLLPSPKLTATDIKIYNQRGIEGSDHPLATVKSLIANLALVPLLNGNFEVQMMSMVEPEIWVKVMSDGHLNWQTPLTDEQRENLENIDISLDSVVLEKAKVNFEDEKHGVSTQLDNLNGEIIAESVFGPYRIEGSYVKGRSPEGFALSLGQFSESFATSVNFVLNQPASQSYLRFDGTILLKNDAINGNFIVESQKLKEFYDSTLPNQVLDENLDYPLAMSLELDANKTKINMSNIVVKFGSSAGAGNILIPLFENEFVIDDNASDERRKIEAAFNMTDLDLTPFIALLKKGIEKQSKPESLYNPEFEFDVLADLKAIKTTYNGQNIRDFVFSADYVDNNFNIRELTGVFPGETQVQVIGDIFAEDEELAFKLDTQVVSNDAQKFFTWAGYEIHPVVPSTYRRLAGKATVSGMLTDIKLSPLNVTLDKTVVKGEVGIMRGERPKYSLTLASDSINFDNYVPGLGKEYADKSFKERMSRRFEHLGFLNDVDIDFQGNLDLGIYENVPFEKTLLSFKLNQGVMDIDTLTIGSVANSALSLEGKLSGFGKDPQVTNLKYGIETNNLDSFLNKFDLPRPDWDLKEAQQFKSQGIITGDISKAAVKTVSKLGNVDLTYSGRISNTEEGYRLNGDVEVKAPDFVKFVNMLNLNYNPKGYALGLFSLNSHLVGSNNVFKMTEMNAFVGANNFQGTLWVDRSGDKPNIVSEMNISRFEPERFFYNGASKGIGVPAVGAAALRPNATSDKVDFLAKPFWDKTRFNYDFYKTFTLSGKFDIGDLIFAGHDLKKASVAVDIRDGKIKLNHFAADLNAGKFTADAELRLTDKPELSTKFAIDNQDIDEEYWTGTVYGVRSGHFSASGQLTMPAFSVEEMIYGAKGNVKLNVTRPVIKGWDWLSLIKDLAQRDHSDGLAPLAQNMLRSGETVFDNLQADIQFDNGVVKVRNCDFVSPGIKIAVEDDTNLETWDMNSTFWVSLSEIPQIPSFDFRLSGLMNAPELTVNVKPITDIYDAKWAKDAADKEAAEQARNEYLQGLMLVQQQTAQNSKNLLEQEVLSVYNQQSRKVVSEEAKNKYLSLKEEIDKVSSGLEEIFTLGLTQEFDEVLPQALAKRNEALESKIQQLKPQVQNVYLEDLKYQVNDFYNQVREMYNQSKEKANVYRDKFTEFPKRLMKIETEYNLDTDKLVNQLRQDIESNLLAIDEQNSEMSREYGAVQNMTESKDLEDFLQKIKSAKEKIVKEDKALDDNIKRLLDYVAESVSLEEETYQAKVKAEEQAKKVQENIGKISASTGKNKTIVRDIDEIEKSEKLQNEEQIKVLNFSKGNDNLAEPVAPKTNYQTGGVVRKTSGNGKARGVIVKK